MKHINKVFIILFAVCSIAALLSLFFFKYLYVIFNQMTLVLVFLLFVYYLLKTKKFDRFKLFILSGVLSGFIAQLFFISSTSRPESFLGGLAFFLFGHIFYILGFSKFRFSVNPLIIAAAASVGISYDTFLFFHIYPINGLPVFIAVVCYTFFLLSMFLSSLSFDLAVKKSFHTISVGGLIFVISDMIFSYFIFVNQFAFGDFAVLITYFTAQGLIGFGMINYFFGENKK